ncbi:MAG: hypothetical protein ACYCXG_04010 [Acidiferrobacter sp.]
MSENTAPRYTRDQDLAFAVLRIGFGVIWVINTLLEANGPYVNHFLASIVVRERGQPGVVQAYMHMVVRAISAVGPHEVAIATIILNGLLALSLLTGIALRPLARIGVGYSLLLWSTVGGLGGPYVAGATDPGTAIVYALTFFTILSVPSEQRLTLGGHPRRVIETREIEVVRILFGLLWAFDAFWKWQPAFLEHSLSYLRASEIGQPAWIVFYIGTFVRLCGLFGTLTFGIFAAIAETILAVSLLWKRGLQWSLPLGALYSFGVWTTAEGWGGPYAVGSTGNRGDMLGTANMYIIVYLYLMVAYRYGRGDPKRRASAVTEGDK